MEKTRYQLRCLKCRYSRISENNHDGFNDLYEIQGCTNCGGPRKYRCPECGRQAKAIRITDLPSHTGTSFPQET